MDKEQVMPCLRFQIMINKQRWTIKLYTPARFNKLWPDTLGVTEYDHKKGLRRISFKKHKISKDTVAHELMHAYLSYKDYSKYSYGKIEESICEVIGKKHKPLYHITNRLFSRLTKKKRG